MASKAERSAALKDVSAHPWNLERLSPELKADQEVVLTAVTSSAPSLRHADPSLKADRDFVLQVLRRVGSALEYVAAPLREDRAVVLTAVRNHGLAAAYASDALRDDREVMLVAVRQQGTALKDASQRLLQDRDLVYEAVKQNGTALMHAKHFQDDPEVALEALKTSPNAIRYVSPELRSSKSFMLQAVQVWGGLIKLAAEALQSDWDVVLRAVRQDPTAMDAVVGLHPCNTAIRLKNEPSLVAAIENAIAFAGEVAPIVAVQRVSPCRRSSSGEHLECEASLLSGRLISCCLDRKASLNDLALALKQRMPQKEPQRVYLTFHGHPPVDPLKGCRKLSDYCC